MPLSVTQRPTVGRSWRGGHRDRPGPSIIDIGLTALFAMLWLAWAKRRAAAALDSRALQADAFQAPA